MDEHVGTGVDPSERAQHAGGGGSTPERRRRMSASDWRDAFLAAGEVSLKTRPADARDAEIGRLKAKVGDLTMANELLEAKIERLETSRPLAPRRSRR